MENLIYPDGLVVRHNGPVVSVRSGGSEPPVIPLIEYDGSDNHVKVHIEFITGDSETSATWSHSTVFMGPPIESVSVKWDGMAADYYYPTANIILKGGPGITTDVPYYQVADMFEGDMECLEIRFDAIRMKPEGLAVRGDLFADCKMPDWVIPH